VKPELSPYRAVLCVFLLALSAPAVRAQEEPAPEPVRFLIETITVQGPKAAPANIVRAETLLKEGESYTEEQLRQAIYRVHRLPFVLDASFSLRKGSERGAYELLIEVQPARWFFYDHWIRAFRFDEPLDLDDSFRRGLDSSFDLGGLVGARVFVGRSGVVFAALDSEDGGQIGFTQYDLFGRGILASAGASRNLCCLQEVLPIGLDPTFSSWTYEESSKLSVSVSVPLGGRQSFQIAASERWGQALDRDRVILQSRDFSGFFLEDGDLKHRRVEAKWVYDTSDDPLLPTRGVSASAGLEASRFEGSNLREIRFFGVPEPVERRLPEYEAEQIVAAVSGIRHWSVTPRQTVSITGRLAFGQSRIENLLVEDRIRPVTDFDHYSGSVGVQHAVLVRRSREAGNANDLRLETGFELAEERISPAFAVNPLERLQIWTGLVFRHPWGRIRLMLSYLDVGEVLR
jgi:Omp85 superfamily domain